MVAAEQVELGRRGRNNMSVSIDKTTVGLKTGVTRLFCDGYTLRSTYHTAAGSWLIHEKNDKSRCPACHQ